MIPDQYSEHLNLYIQAKDESAGSLIFDNYSAKMALWAQE